MVITKEEWTRNFELRVWVYKELNRLKGASKGDAYNRLVEISYDKSWW